MSDNEKPQFESGRTTLALSPETTSANDPMRTAEERMRRALGLNGEQPRPRPTQERPDPAPRAPERFSPMGHSPMGHKRRFVHDGEVPVTVVHGLMSGRRDHTEGNGTPTNRLEVAEAALQAEIATREKVERALQEAQASVHDLRTKLGHADLARQEAVEALRRERETVAELRAALHQAEEQSAAARRAQDATDRAVAELRDRPATASAVASEDAPVEPPRRRRGRPPRAAKPAMEEAVAAVPQPPKRPRGRPKKVASAREPQPIRWWLSPRKKKAKS